MSERYLLKAARKLIRGEAMKVVIKPPENMKSAGVGMLLVSHTYYRFVEKASLGTREGDKAVLT